MPPLSCPGEAATMPLSCPGEAATPSCRPRVHVQNVRLEASRLPGCDEQRCLLDGLVSVCTRSRRGRSRGREMIGRGASMINGMISLEGKEADIRQGTRGAGRREDRVS